MGARKYHIYFECWTWYLVTVTGERSSYSLVPIFVLAGGVNALAGVLFKLKTFIVHILNKILLS